MLNELKVLMKCFKNSHKVHINHIWKSKDRFLNKSVEFASSERLQLLYSSKNINRLQKIRCINWIHKKRMILLTAWLNSWTKAFFVYSLQIVIYNLNFRKLANHIFKINNFLIWIGASWNKSRNYNKKLLKDGFNLKPLFIDQNL